MPTTKKSPHATSFNSAIKRGTPAGIAVDAIARRSNTRPGAVFSSLHKAGLCHRQKFNGQWVYWACEGRKSNATVTKSRQSDFWQSFIDWCIAGGHCTSGQLAEKVSARPECMNYCRGFFNRQFPGASSSSRRGRTAKRTVSRKRTTARKSRPTSYKFPRTESTTRRLRRAA